LYRPEADRTVGGDPDRARVLDAAGQTEERPLRHHRWFRVLALLVPLVLLAAACGDDDDDDTTAGDDTSETTAADEGDGGGEEGVKVGLVYDLGGRGDQSFNDAAGAGLDQAKDELGVEASELEPDEGGENREELMRLLADDGNELIFGIGFLFGDSITAAAPDYPDTTFAIVDSVVESDNVASLTFAENEGSFLVGAAAAIKSTTGHIGFIGGVEVDLIKKFEAGYVAGAKHINPDVTVDVSYITQPPDFAGFNDPARAKEIAAGMYGAGADVIYHAAGGSGGGLFEAAKEASEASADDSQVWAIGVDSDQYNIVDASLQPYILTSMLKKVEVAVFDTIKRFTEGEAIGGAVTVYDLSAGGVDYATSGGFVDDIKDQLEDLKQQIIDGEIEVPTTP
jgi:basic membrane protein A